MKKIFFIFVFTACLFTALYAGDSFKTGNSYYTAGQYDKALEQYGNFIKQEPKKFEGYYNAGDALFRQGQYEQALQMFNKSLELAPKDKDTRANIDVTQEKIKEQQQNQQQNKNGKNGKNQQQNGQSGQGSGGQNSGNGQNGQDQKSGKGNQGKQGQQNNSGQQQGQNGEAQQGQNGQGAQASQAKKPPNGMTPDEVQALMNQVQNQEKQYRNYFGNQYRSKQNQGMPDIFNMSPRQIQNYMMQQMMDPNQQQQQPQQGGNGDEKDW
jgi:Ca-activated chloride channel family protein